MRTAFPEHLLRTLWQEQSFATTHLHTADGKPVTILSPGRFNSDGGPDYIDARIRIGNTLYRGDIELHTNTAEWQRHYHHRDPHYNRVILHVVMTADELSPPTRTATDRNIPVLVLHPYLDESVRARLMGSTAEEEKSTTERLRCYGVNDNVPPSLISRWIAYLAAERLELKIRRIEERLKQLIDERRSIVREPYPRYYGSPDEIPPPQKTYTHMDFLGGRIWEQVLYEGVMEGLGYSKNQRPFLTLAQSMQLDFLRKHGLEDRETTIALLFGAAGLLPSTRTLEDKGCRAYVRPLRGKWARLRKTFRNPTLNEGDWLFFRLRPSNFPTARLASMCFLLPALFGDQGLRNLINTFKDAAFSPERRLQSLQSLFRFEADDFWNHHYHFNGASARGGIALGADRVNDILVNSIIPTVLLYARVFKDQSIRANARSVLTVLPTLQESHIIRTMEAQLLSGRVRIATSHQHQGVVQLFKFYCLPSRCEECRVGQHVFGK